MPLLYHVSMCCSDPSITNEPAMSVKDASDNTIDSSGTTGVNFTSFEITFPAAMNQDSVTTAGNITVTCEDIADENQPSVAVVLSSDDADDGLVGNEFTVTNSSPSRTVAEYQLLNCTLTLNTDITRSSGTALPEALTYQFTNGCAMSDYFNIDSRSCWTLSNPNIGGTVLSSWDDISSVLNINVEDETIDYSATSEEVVNYLDITLRKESVSVSESGFEMVISLTTNSSFGTAEYVSIVLSNPDTYNYAAVGISGLGNDVDCFVRFSDHGDQFMATASHNCSLFNDIYVKLTATPDSWTMSYSSDGINYTEFTNGEITEEDASVPTSSTDFLSGSTELLFYLYFRNVSGSASATVYQVVVSGISSSTHF